MLRKLGGHIGAHALHTRSCTSALVVMHNFKKLGLHCKVSVWFYHCVRLIVHSLCPFRLAFLALKASSDLFSSSKCIPVASFSIITSDILIFLLRTPKNKKNTFIIKRRTKGGKFVHSSSRLKIKKN